ncbi:MAG: hypothetical protein RL173_1822 [Fibrobacterota bacterium]|jgi:M6 family metalloprotease-like protein
MSITVRGNWLACTILAAVSIAQAAPMWGTRMDFEQPDGSKVPVLLYGDEYFQRTESLDSLALVRDSDGWICYATIADDSASYVSTGVRYKGASDANGHSARALQWTAGTGLSEDATMSIRDSVYRLLHQGSTETEYPMPRQGGAFGARSSSSNSVRTVIGLTIPVDFSDAPATISQQVIDDMMNKDGFSSYGNNGSVRQYFHDVSSGHLDYTNIVVPYVRMSKPKSYYNNSKIPFGTMAQELAKEALKALEDGGFDFTSLSADGSNNIYAVNILYAGTAPGAWSTGLWPHKGAVGGISYDGMKPSAYQMTNLGAEPDIGVICHENGHMVMGWPDLYDYSYKTQGTGGYDLMSSSIPRNPVRPNAYLRDLAGWDEVVELDSFPAGKLVLPSNSGHSARYDNPLNAKEHFYVESCRKTGRGANLPDEGLMIWHVDENGSNNNGKRTASKHYLVSLEQADGKYDLESKRGTGAGDLFHAGYRDLFGPATTPNSKWWSGKASNFRISGIGPVADTMTCFWAGGTNNPMLPAVKPSKAIPGLLALYKEGNWATMPSFSLKSAKSTSVANSVTSSVPGAASTNYAIGFDGYFIAPSDGAYTFTGESDAGIRVWIDGNLLADQNASSSSDDATFSVVLAKGHHLLRINYLHGVSSAKLKLNVAGGGIVEGAIPLANLAHETKATYSNDPTLLTTSSLGLRYSYYEGTWTKLPDFDTVVSVRTGLTQTVGTKGVGTVRSKDFGIVLEGFVNVPKLASYTFTLKSADGSRLSIDGDVVAKNDGLHPNKSVSAGCKLYPGLHAIKVEYFQHKHSPSLALAYSTSGVSKRAIPAGMFYNDGSEGLAPGEGLFENDPMDDEGSDEPAETEDDAHIRMIGGMLRIELPRSYEGEALIDLIDAKGRLLNTVPANAGSGLGEVYVKHRGSANMVIVRIRMDGRTTITKMVPLTF